MRSHNNITDKFIELIGIPSVIIEYYAYHSIRGMTQVCIERSNPLRQVNKKLLGLYFNWFCALFVATNPFIAARGIFDWMARVKRFVFKHDHIDKLFSGLIFNKILNKQTFRHLIQSNCYTTNRPEARFLRSFP